MGRLQDPERAGEEQDSLIFRAFRQFFSRNGRADMVKSRGWWMRSVGEE